MSAQNASETAGSVSSCQCSVCTDTAAAAARIALNSAQPANEQKTTDEEDTRSGDDDDDGNSDEDEDECTLIAVIGPTGAGKSSFISALSKDEITVGHGLHSSMYSLQRMMLVNLTSKATKEIVVTTLKLEDYGDISLVDTPGFDDTFNSDLDTLENLAEWLHEAYDKGQLLSGILWFQPIMLNRATGSSLRCNKLFGKLCGRDNLQNVLLVSTFWNETDQATGQAREDELKTTNELWKSLIDDGAEVERLGRDYDRFVPILKKTAQNKRKALEIQNELAEGKTLVDTTAGQYVNSEKKKLEEEYENKVAEIERQKAEEVARQAEEHQRKQQEIERQRQEQLQREEQERVQMEERLRQQEQEHQEQIRQEQEQLERDRQAAQAPTTHTDPPYYPHSLYPPLQPTSLAPLQPLQPLPSLEPMQPLPGLAPAPLNPPQPPQPSQDTFSDTSGGEIYYDNPYLVPPGSEYPIRVTEEAEYTHNPGPSTLDRVMDKIDRGIDRLI